MKTLRQYILEKAAGFRCGLILPYQVFDSTFCHLDGIYNISIPQDERQGWHTASGSIGRDKNQAVMGAIGEALERENASRVRFPIKQGRDLAGENILFHSDFALYTREQYDAPGFAWKRPEPSEVYYGECFSLTDGRPCWVPQELIGLGTQIPDQMPPVPSTSTGLAAHTTPRQALTGGLLELLERDALTVTWMNSLGGREMVLPDHYTMPVKAKGGQVRCFDITQAWNPCPVVIVCGFLLRKGKPNISLGCACRFDRQSAVEKAWLEWMQGTTFAGYYLENNPDLRMPEPADIDDFDKHAAYYTLYPGRWGQTPLIRGAAPYAPPEKAPANDLTLEALAEALAGAGIDLFYRDLTFPDARQSRVTVVRVLSPQLSQLHGDENMPFLGGRTNDAEWRYPGLAAGAFPNPFPHPLG